MVQWITGAICAGNQFISLAPPWLGADWISLSALALFASVVLLAIIYVIGVIFSNQELVIFTKFEIYEIGATILIILALVIIAGTGCSLKVESIFTNSIFKGNLYDVSFQYLEAIDARIIGWMTSNHMAAMTMDQLASTTIYAKPLGLGLVTSPGAGIGSPLKNMLYQTTNAMAIAFIINHAQIAVLEFTLYGFLKYYLPIGIILRAFTPTRRIGGTIIALGIGFLIIYPILTVLTAEVVYSPIKNLDESFTGKVWDETSGHLGKTINNIFKSDTNYENLIKNSVLDTTKDPLKLDPNYDPTKDTGPQALPSVGEEESIMGMIWNIINGKYILGLGKELIFHVVLMPMASVAMAFAAGFVMPALNILIFVQALKSLSRTLGEEIDITALTRMI